MAYDQKNFISLLALASFAFVVAGCASTPKTKPVSTKPSAQSSTKSKAPPSSSHTGVAPETAAAGSVEVCKMTVSNLPRVDAAGRAVGGPLVALKGVALIIAPVTNSCLSSGYGPRNGRPHKGVDYYTKTSGDVLAAGDGVIIEAVTRADFGNMIVIDHGGGVFTRYGHLEGFAPKAKLGATVKRGDKLGPIGATGATSVRHLHYEILSGAYVKGAGSFGLATHDPFSLPKASAKTAALSRDFPKI